MTELPRAPAHVEPYIEALGFDLAVEFLLEFGGTAVYLPDRAGGRGEVERFLGAEKLKALKGQEHRMSARVPRPKRWLAMVLRAQGLSEARTARKVGVTDKTIRQWMRGPGGNVSQLSLF